MTSRVGRPPRTNQNPNRAFPLPVRIFFVYLIYDITEDPFYIDYNVIEVILHDRILLKNKAMHHNCAMSDNLTRYLSKYRSINNSNSF